jgi:antitoxin YefM
LLRLLRLLKLNVHEEAVITRVVVSNDDHRSRKETAYLLRSPENARRLVASIERIGAGRGIRRDLAE